MSYCCSCMIRENGMSLMTNLPEIQATCKQTLRVVFSFLIFIRLWLLIILSPVQLFSASCNYSTTG